MAFQAYIAVKGKKQGQFKGEAAAIQRKDKWMQVLGFTMGLTSPRDPSTGQATGRRQFQPVTIVKQWGAASPQGLAACSTNESLAEVDIEFTKTTAAGLEAVYQTVKLTDASIASPDAPTAEKTRPSRAIPDRPTCWSSSAGRSRFARSRCTTPTAIRALPTT
jgi:type VI secretion system secreted protein Hcp